MTRHVLHLLGTAQPEGSGVARIVASLAGGLDPAKYRVHAWFLGPDGPLVEELRVAGATARWVNWSSGAREPFGAYRFWQGIHGKDFAIVHQHYGARSVRQLMRLASDARLVVHLHGRITDPISEGRIPIAVRGADAVIAVAQSVALQVPASKPEVVYSGVECSEQFREASRVSTDVVVGAACRLVPLKGLIPLIHAIASLSLEYPRLRLEIAGAGPQREELEREIHRLGMEDRIQLLGWQQEPRHVFRTWDIFAMPTLDEGLPIAALEAMAEGLPIVATAVGGLPEVVEDGHTGFLVPPQDAEALAGALRCLISDPELRRSMGDAGQRRVAEKFSVRGMVSRIESIYDSLIQSGGL